jgi:predicted RNase H-like HicB family nuclease
MSSGDDSEEIRLTRPEGQDSWTAVDVATGVASQGRTREKALENLDEALAGYHGAGEEPSDDELRALGVDPEENESSGDLPSVLQ